MTEVLYRKYRPQKFAEVIDQEVAKTILRGAIKNDRVGHAYLFTGPRGVGKTTLARIFAKAVNCNKAEAGEPCGKCESCQLIQTGRSLEVIEIDAASYTGVDNIREVIEHVKYPPTTGTYKVFIIDEVHMLSKAAFNALLKTLEEPPVHALFILATTEVHKVPATIVSRSQRLDFKSVSEAGILTLFEKIVPELPVKIEPEAQRLIARAAYGSFRDALSILDQIVSFSAGQVDLKQAEEILGLTRIDISQQLLDLIVAKDQPTLVNFVRELAFSGKDLVQFTQDFLSYLQMLLYVKLEIEQISKLGLSAEEQERLQAQAAKVSGSRLLDIIKELLKLHREIKGTSVPELPFAVAMLRLTEDSSPTPTTATKQKPKPAAEKKADKSQVANSSEVSHGTIVEQWREVLSKIKEYNHSLISSMRLGRIVEVDGENLVLAFPYNFHKEIVEARKNKIVIDQVLEEVFSTKLRVKPVLEREVKSEEQGSDASEPTDGQDLLSEAMKILGGTNT